MRKQNRTFLFLNIVLLGIFIFSCSKKEEQKKIEEQFSDTVKTGSDSIFASSTSKFTSNEVRKKFNEIKKKYENELDVVANTEVRFSDLNGDGKDEALLYYGLAAKGGNAMTGSGLILYKINDDKLEFLSDYNLDGAVIKSIKDGQLNCVKYEYAAGDPSCCPSKKKPFKLKFENNKLNFIP